MRGGHFVPWREMPLFESYDLHAGDGFAAPPRWPHWIEHPGPDPAVSFEVGYWTADDIRARKVWDVNWLLRKAKLSPRPPGEVDARDRRKRKVFDAISVVTRKGGEFRGTLASGRARQAADARTPTAPSIGRRSRRSKPSRLGAVEEVVGADRAQVAPARGRGW